MAEAEKITGRIQPAIDYFNRTQLDIIAPLVVDRVMRGVSRDDECALIRERNSVTGGPHA